MSRREDLVALRGRVKDARGPDRDIDGDLKAAFDPPPVNWSDEPANVFVCYDCGDQGVFKTYVATPASVQRLVPNYTGSLDAALVLVRRMLPGWRWVAHSPRSGLAFGASLSDPARGGAVRVGDSKVSAPLAILDALLAALTQESVHARD